ncbi:outer membrane lipoprotein-sorting protein [Desulfatitalea alkaliphila]|uniref:Outer membrane lipoprotein-sorting protein n=1 Tax=Desulfatitalea alkaliphila TaxID=2929485 RepID=A0AA41RBK4_9BACT|nr:outer membrane lipoprotein-sorting protein [Desulfatitalea alkaliphila]MCJ8502133.1 outer membrane lipoprotein-sorting protein [Desulfatitalea alkaliphila]
MKQMDRMPRAIRKCKSLRPFTGCGLLRVLMATVLLWFFSAIPAPAAMLQGAHVLELMVRALSGADTLRVEQLVVFDEPDAGEAASRSLNETLFYAFPGRLRSETPYRQSLRIRITRDDRHTTLVDGRPVARKIALDERYGELFLFRSRQDLHRMLLADGVDVENTSLGLADERIVYVLGARYPDPSVPQVWIDRERLLPLRWVRIHGDDPTRRVTFHYRQWRQQDGQWYPAQIAVYQGLRLVRRIDVRKVETDVALPEHWFDPESLIASPPVPTAPSAPEAATTPDDLSAEEDLVRQLIQEALQGQMTEEE